MHKKRPKICNGCRVIEVKIYLYHSTKIAKARPHSVEWQLDSSVVHGQGQGGRINSQGVIRIPVWKAQPSDQKIK